MEKQKFYQTTWFMWLMIVVLPPIGLVLVALNKGLEAKKKKTCFIVGGIWCALVLIIGAFSPKKENTTVVATSPTPEATVETTTEPTQDTSGLSDEDKQIVIEKTKEWTNEYNDVAEYVYSTNPSDWSWAKYEANNVLVASTTFNFGTIQKVLYESFSYDSNTQEFTGHWFTIDDNMYANDGAADAFVEEMKSLVPQGAITAAEQEPTESTDPSGFTYDDHMNFITITQQISDKYLANYDAPWGESDYQFAKFDDNGAIMVITKYVFKNDPEKKNVYCVFTYDKENESFVSHYLEVGGKVYESDGYIDAFLEQLQAINDAYNESSD